MRNRPYRPHAGVRAALEEIDRIERAKGTCPRCGLPRRGVQYATTAIERSTRSGRLHAGVQTRAEAGLCTCPAEPTC